VIIAIANVLKIIKSVSYSLKFKQFWILFQINSSMLIKSGKTSRISSIDSFRPFVKHKLISSLMSMKIWPISIWQMCRRRCMTALLTTKEVQIKSTKRIYFRSQTIWMLKMMQKFAQNIWKSWINFLRT
jgi:hypothetical protein